MEGKKRNRAESLLPEVLPDIIALLKAAPEHGQVGLDIVFHNGRISRVVTRKEACRKAVER